MHFSPSGLEKWVASGLLTAEQLTGEKFTGKKEITPKTVGCGEKSTGFLRDAEKRSLTTLNHKSATSEMSEVV